MELLALPCGLAGDEGRGLQSADPGFWAQAGTVTPGAPSPPDLVWAGLRDPGGPGAWRAVGTWLSPTRGDARLALGPGRRPASASEGTGRVGPAVLCVFHSAAVTQKNSITTGDSVHFHAAEDTAVRVAYAAGALQPPTFHTEKGDSV